jgi:hypothetical protein
MHYQIVYLAENFGNIKMIIHIHGWYLWGVPPQHRFQPLFMTEFSVELTFRPRKLLKTLESDDKLD